MSPRLLLAAALALPALPSCSQKDDTPLVSARVAATRVDLVGGRRALGDIGDIVMENDQVRLVIQGPGFSRGFGIYGGSLIDADLRRTDSEGNTLRGRGYDNFAEMFPAFFLQATAVDKVEIESDGSDGGPARVVASGTTGDFLEIAAVLNRVAIGSHPQWLQPESENNQPKVAYSTVYELAPGARHVKIVFRIENLTENELSFPDPVAKGVLAGFLGADAVNGLTLPLADIMLYGKTNKVFAPGVGFITGFAIQDAYKETPPLPAFPGLVTDFMASRGKHVSYGLAIEEVENNFVYNKRDTYDRPDNPVSKSSLLIPFSASGFFGIFHGEAPPSIPAGETVELMTKYFVIGDGDVGSIVDEILAIRGEPVGRLGGQVFEELGAAFAEDGAYVVVYQKLGSVDRIFSQYNLRASGTFSGDLPPGKYCARVVGEGRPLGACQDFEIRAGQETGLQLTAHAGASITVRITDADGIPMPGKATAVGVYGKEHAGEDPRTFLYDLAAGEEHRGTDQVTDTDDPQTRRYLEAWGHADFGKVTLHVRPGDYTVVVSRGPEYGTAEKKVSVGPGETASLTVALAPAVDTTGWIASDLHLHSVGSIDSGMSVDDRVRAIAAEGVEWAVSTDHNYVTDYAPHIERTGLRDFLNATIGLEATTLESGHFNGYPLRYDVTSMTHGSFDWPKRPPDQLFEEIRSLGKYGPEDTIVQVNHPRDTILGYFEQYARNALTFDKTPSGVSGQFTDPKSPAFVDEAGATTFSFDFDAVEVLNGKLFWQIRHYRVPEELPEGELPEMVPPAGTILLDEDGEVAFPGVIDDWFNLLNLGHRKVAVGTSDTHNGEDEAGYFRTMIHVGKDAPRLVTERDFVDGLRSFRVYATNGPIIELWVNDRPLGSELVDGDGKVEVRLRCQTAPWVGTVDRLNLYRNGVLVRTFEPDSRDFTDTAEIAVDVDSWFALEAVGSHNMFPVVRANEEPPIQISDALSSLTGPLGLGGDYGALEPSLVFPVTPYAITNPVWVKVDDGEWDAPGVVPVEELQAADQFSGLNNNPKAARDHIPRRFVARVKPVREPVEPLFVRDRNNPYDVRHLFSVFGHGH